MEGIKRWLFGSTPNSNLPPSEVAPQRSTNREDILEERQARQRALQRKLKLNEKKIAALDKQAEEAEAQAKFYAKQGDKKKGMMFLKKANLYKNQSSKLSAMNSNLESAAMNAESMSTTVTMVNGMKDAASMMSQMKEEFDVDDIIDVTDSISDHIKDHTEIQDILSQPIDDWGDAAVSEFELEEEFESFVREEEERQAIMATANLPNAPTKPITSTNDQGKPPSIRETKEKTKEKN